MTVTYSGDVAGGGYYSSVTKTYYKSYDGAVSAESAYNAANTSPYSPPVAQPGSYNPPPPSGGNSTPPPPYIPPATTPSGREIDYGDIPTTPPPPPATTPTGREIDYGEPTPPAPSTPSGREIDTGEVPTWVVTTPDGETAEFNDYMDAVDYVEDLQPAAPTQPPPTIDLNIPQSPIFVDAPGMESYVSGLNIPTTQSGVTSQGWVDAQIGATSKSIHEFGRALEASAKKAKLSGNNLAAGAQAGAAIGVGVASALFDDATWLLNTYENTVPNVVSEFSENPLFATGYVGGNVALVLYGGSQLYQGVKGKSLKDLKNWFDEPDRFIDVNPQQLSEAKTIAFNKEYDERFREVATEWPEGSPELAVKRQMGADSIAYSMVDMDSDYTALMTPLDLDTPLIRYPTYVPPNPTVAAALAGLGVTGIANSLLVHSKAFIESSSPLTNPATIRAVLKTTPQQIPIAIPGSEVKPIVISESVPIQEPISTPYTITVSDPISDTVVIQDPVVIEESAVDQTPITDTPVVPDMVVPVVPAVSPPEDAPPRPILMKGKPVITKREEQRRRRDELKPSFTVRMRYGRKSVTRSVDAGTFREALAKVLRGSPSEVEVRRRR